MATPLDDLREIPTGTGRVAVTWLGQAGFALRSRQTTLMIDPFLSPHEGRRYESTLPAAPLCTTMVSPELIAIRWPG